MGQDIWSYHDVVAENNKLKEANSYASISLNYIYQQSQDDKAWLQTDNEILIDENNELQQDNNELQLDKQCLEKDNQILTEQNIQLKQENVRLLKENESFIENIPALKRILIVMIFIDKYDNPPSQHNKLKDLPGSTIDKERIMQLFTGRYKYDIIMNSKSKVRFKDIDGILDAAKKRFQLKDGDESETESSSDENDDEKYDTDHGVSQQNYYEGIMVFYSGHGDEHNLYLSSWNRNENRYDTYDRTKFESYFNGENCPGNVNDYKFYFIDSCRGSKKSKVVDTAMHVNNKGFDSYQLQSRERRYIHNEHNTHIMYSNSNTYQAYEVPYDKTKKDIAWDKMDDEKYDGDYCSLFMNMIYHAFDENANNQFVIHLSALQDKIREKARSSAVTEIGAKKLMIGLEPNVSTNLYNKRQNSIKFEPNDEININDKKIRDAADNKYAKSYKLKIKYC